MTYLQLKSAARVHLHRVIVRLQAWPVPSAAAMWLLRKARWQVEGWGYQNILHYMHRMADEHSLRELTQIWGGTERAAARAAACYDVRNGHAITVGRIKELFGAGRNSRQIL